MRYPFAIPRGPPDPDERFSSEQSYCQTVLAAWHTAHPPTSLRLVGGNSVYGPLEVVMGPTENRRINQWMHDVG